MRTRSMGSILLLAAILMFAAPSALSAHEDQSKDQQKCINTMNKDGAKVAATQGKEITSCIKNAGKGKEADPDGCLTRDSKGKVAKTASKTQADYDKKCVSAPPDFGLPGVSTGTASGLVAGTVGAVVDAAINAELQVAAGVFGSPLSAAIVTDKDGAKCQAAVSKDYEKTIATYMKGFLKCKKSALKAGASSTEDLEACVLDDPRGKAASSVSKLAADIGKSCADNLFPGSCSAEPLDGLADCIHVEVRCGVCFMQNDMDGLAVNCDAADDGVVNESCVVPANLIVRQRIASLAPAANIGHRGAGINRAGDPLPENSIPSFVDGMAQGADGIELDVELTADGQLVVMHDDTMDRTTTCTGCVNTFTLAEARECFLLDGDGNVTTEIPPTLEEVYAALPASALVNVELKVFEPPCETPETGPVALAQAAVAEIKALGVENRSFFSSFDLTAAAAVKEEDPNLYSAFLILVVASDTIANATEASLDAIHPGFFLSAENVSAMLAAGLQVNVWTVNSESNMQQSIDKGVSSIITDEPAVLVQVLAANP